MSKDRLIIVDISSFIFRAFFAIRPMHTPDGTPVNSVYGVMTMLMKLLNSYKPTHMILARDLSGGSFRNEIYPEYKANRGDPPEELVPQFALIKKLIDTMKVPAFALQNYEADDIIGSLAVQYKDQFDEILIASGDKDLMQFVDDKVKMLDTMKEKTYGPKEVFEKMGVHPEQIVDYLSLLGDSSDNIPGVKGIGAKGAATLLAQFPTLDELIENLDDITNKRAKTSLSKGIEQAKLSKSLVKIVTDLPIKMTKDDLKFSLEPHEELLNYMDELNFKSMKAKILGGSSGIDSSAKPSSISYTVIKNEKKYLELLEILEDFDQSFVEVFFREGTYQNLSPEVLGVSTPEKNYILYINEIKSFVEFVRDLTTLEDLKIVTDSSKAFYYAALDGGFELTNEVFDITQAHFILSPDKKHDLASICTETMNDFTASKKEILKEALEAPQSIRNYEYALAKRSELGLKSYTWLLQKLFKNKLYSLYEQMDGPLQKILAKMEFEGVDLDKKYLSSLEEKFTKQILEIEKQIEDVAGEKINLKSPKQVGVLLFETLGLPVIKKTKTGFSTNASVLETLDEMGESEIPGLILKHREIGKLLSTYVGSLSDMTDEEGKIHTHFNQAVAATGRLSSDQPNLQNIPIKTENGRLIRKAFTAPKGYQFVGADYSQVELRILAHLSGDDVMVKAFNNDEDIHAQTAAQVFDLNLDEVTSEQRSYAKAINFGLMYGQSSFGLSQMLKISPGEAKEYITQYFERFAKVKSYLDTLKESCEEKGYTETIFGRQREIKDINSTNRQVKSMAERMAINTPIQGTAADIIKKAMIALDTKLTQQKLESKMLLQVHDELIFLVPDKELEVMRDLIQNEMEGVTKLSVPLKVDINQGQNWYELK